MLCVAVRNAHKSSQYERVSEPDLTSHLWLCTHFVVRDWLIWTMHPHSYVKCHRSVFSYEFCITVWPSHTTIRTPDTDTDTDKTVSNGWIKEIKLIFFTVASGLQMCGGTVSCLVGISETHRLFSLVLSLGNYDDFIAYILLVTYFEFTKIFECDRERE